MIAIAYMIKVVTCSALLSVYYYLFLRNCSFHMYNRYVILFIYVLSIVLPLVEVPFGISEALPDRLPVLYDSGVTRLPEVMLTFRPEADAMNMSWLSAIEWLYYLIALLFLWQLVLSFRYILKLKKTSPSEKVADFHIYFTSAPNTPFSFFRWIFWNNEIDIETTVGQQVLTHELQHVNQNHSIDILVAEVIRCIFWFNPFFHLLKRELTTIHEFLADKAAVSAESKFQYAELLLTHTIKEKKLALTHTFFQNQIKRRIFMITNTKKTNFGYARRLLAIPLFLMVAFSCSQNKEETIGLNSRTASVKHSGAESNNLVDTIPLSPKDFVTKMRSDTSAKITMATGYDKIYLSSPSGGVYSILTNDLDKYEQATSMRTGEIIFTKTPFPAEFPGGRGAWLRYLNKNFRYPDEAVEKEIQGTVLMRFIVEKDGYLADLRVISGPEALRNEALRMIRQSGRWVPAKHEGRPVRSLLEFPITFVLQSE